HFPPQTQCPIMKGDNTMTDYTKEPLIQTHAYINIVMEDKKDTLRKLKPVLSRVDADEIDEDSFDYEVRIYFDGQLNIQRVIAAEMLISNALFETT
ncbi:MAG: hypothetical protein MI861_14950, partial [Pirellulales bacterium]|nr:hypothetical protein [Pirellulales bacterium]